MFVTFEISADNKHELDHLKNLMQAGSSVTSIPIESIDYQEGETKLLGMGKESSITLQVTYKCNNQEEADLIRENLKKQAKQPIAVSVSYKLSEK